MIALLVAILVSIGANFGLAFLVGWWSLLALLVELPVVCLIASEL